ncbi:InlB B-repeat-containing protein [Faecalispora jeddahensis]|uniref:InlB B-repeat-containing protein n=1 Tax=Faecalispora jeddahensis TaxID=1414721 RepID=UPI0027B88585|nr:Ig-like domain-containing protein [Faecalispora jeddahensis]
MATFFHATVYVRSQTQVTVNSVETVRVTIKPGEMPRLPSTVKVQYNNGAYDNVHTQVEWGEIPEEYLTEPGTYTLTDLGALIVKENVLANDKAATLILKVTGALKITVENGTADQESAEAGETVTITANPAPTGKTFDKWTSEDGIVFADASKAATTFQMPDQPVTVTAVYRSKGGSTSDDDDDDRSGSSKPLPTSPTDPGLGRVWNGEVGPTGGALYLDTKSYSMAPGNIYDIKAVLKGYPISSLKVYSSRSGIARVELLPSGNYRVTGLQSGTTYIMFEAFGTDGSLLNHASVKVDVAPGVIQGGVRNAAASLF